MTCIKRSVTISLLWASAILAAALLNAPAFLTLVLLPVLGYLSIAAANRLA